MKVMVPIALIICAVFWGMLVNVAVKEENKCNSAWWLKIVGILQLVVYTMWFLYVVILMYQANK